MYVIKREGEVHCWSSFLAAASPPLEKATARRPTFFFRETRLEKKDTPKKSNKSTKFAP